MTICFDSVSRTNTGGDSISIRFPAFRCHQPFLPCSPFHHVQSQQHSIYSSPSLTLTLLFVRILVITLGSPRYSIHFKVLNYNCEVPFPMQSKTLPCVGDQNKEIFRDPWLCLSLHQNTQHNQLRKPELPFRCRSLTGECKYGSEATLQRRVRNDFKSSHCTLMSVPFGPNLG